MCSLRSLVAALNEFENTTERPQCDLTALRAFGIFREDQMGMTTESITPDRAATEYHVDRRQFLDLIGSKLDASKLIAGRAGR